MIQNQKSKKGYLDSIFLYNPKIIFCLSLYSAIRYEVYYTQLSYSDIEAKHNKVLRISLEAKLKRKTMK